MSLTAAEVRRDAIRELIDLATGSPDTYPTDLPRRSLDLLYRWALRRHGRDDPALVDYLRDDLMPLARGEAAALHDAAGTHSTQPAVGVPDRPRTPDPDEIPTLDDLREALFS